MTRTSASSGRLGALVRDRRRGAEALECAVAAMLVGTAVAAVHWPVLSAQALSFDDTMYVSDNPLVRKPSWESARRFFTEALSPSTVQGYYQPLSMISLMLDYAAGGRPEDLRAFHRTSLALHMANTALVISVLYLLFGHIWAAALVGLLFGVHPLTVEPVAWVADRKTLLSTLFALVSVALYVYRARHGERSAMDKRKSAILYAGSLGTFVLALLAKPTSTPLPLLLLLLDYWPLRRLSRRVVVEKTPFIFVGALAAVITLISQARTANVTLPTENRALSAPLVIGHNIVFYLWKIVWPANLTSHYPVPEPLTLSQPMVLLGVIGSVVLLTLLLISLRWTRVLAVGWLFFFVAIFPTMGVVRFTNGIAADKFVYLPALGLMLPAAYYLGRLWGACTHRRWSMCRAGLLLAVLLLTGLEGMTTRRYLRAWRDSEGLARHMVRQAPGAFLPHYVLGNCLQAGGRFGEAAAELSTALQFEPGFPEAHNNLGLTLARLGRTDEATAHFVRALRLKPDHAEAHYNLGLTYAGQGRLDDAIAHYRAALRIKPNDPVAHHQLALVLAQQGRADDAISHFKQALRLRPDYTEAYVALGSTLSARGQVDEAMALYRTALRLGPDWVSVENNLAWLLATNEHPRAHDAEEAVRLAERVCQQTGHAQANMLDTLAAAYAAAGRFAEAVATGRQALQIAESQNQSATAEQVRTRLRLYENGQPYREATTSEKRNVSP